MRVAILGTTAEQEKAITSVTQRNLKLKEVDIKLSKQLRDIGFRLMKQEKTV